MQPTMQLTPALAATVAFCAPRSMPPRLHQFYVDAIHCVFTNNHQCIVRVWTDSSVVIGGGELSRLYFRPARSQ
jgi:hypothetical protein